MSDRLVDFRRYQDGFGITHLVGWDDSSRTWHFWCDHARTVPGRREDDHDSRDSCPTCLRCIYERGVALVQPGTPRAWAVLKGRP